MVVVFSLFVFNVFCVFVENGVKEDLDIQKYTNNTKPKNHKRRLFSTSDSESESNLELKTRSGSKATRYTRTVERGILRAGFARGKLHAISCAWRA